MRFRTVLIIFVLVLTTAFFVVNWHVFSTSARFSVIVTSFDAPVGMVMMVVFALIIVTLAVYMGISQSALLLEYRRQAKELQSQRALADNAEASRFTEMGTLVHDEITGLAQRLEASLESMREEFRTTESSIAATLGEMDDRFQRTLGDGAPR